MINRDPDWFGFFTNAYPDFAEHPGESLKDAFGGFLTGGITDIMICIYEQISKTPSDILMWAGDKYLQKTENGFDVDYTDYHFLKGPYLLYTKSDVDPVEVWLRCAKENNIRPWITLRMNDAHENSETVSGLRSDFYYTAKKNGWMIGDKYGYYAHCLDYSRREITEPMLAYIKEQIMRYDCFGLELDFMREIYCFDYEGKDCRRYMNDFMRSVRDILDEAGRRHGHEIRLCVRLPRSYADSAGYGFDPVAWAREKLVDVIVPSPRWETTDSDIPVEEWSALLSPYGVAVVPAVETLNVRRTANSADMSKAYASGWYAAGADGIYANNHDSFVRPVSARDIAFRRSCGDPDSAAGGLRRYIITYQDITSGISEPFRPLPLCAEPGRDGYLILQTGDIRNTDDVRLYFDALYDGEMPRVYINGIECGPVEICGPVIEKNMFDGSEVNLTPHIPLVCVPSGSHWFPCKTYLRFSGSVKIFYAELRVNRIE